MNLFDFSIGLLRDHSHSAVAAGEFPVGFAIITLVADHGARGDVRAEIGEDAEMRRVAFLPASDVEGDDEAVLVGFEMDFSGEATARAAEPLIVLPPFAPAAETWARTTVESNICTRCAEPLCSASFSNNSSNTPLWLKRQKRFHTLFQLPNAPAEPAM